MALQTMVFALTNVNVTVTIRVIAPIILCVVKMNKQLLTAANDLTAYHKIVDERLAAVHNSTDDTDNWDHKATITDRMRKARRLHKVGENVLARKVKKLQKLTDEFRAAELKQMDKAELAAIKAKRDLLRKALAECGPEAKAFFKRQYRSVKQTPWHAVDEARAHVTQIDTYP